MALDWRPWAEWGFSGDEEEHSFRWPARPWEVEDGGVGGQGVAASGIKAAYTIREDQLIHITLRVEEDELPAVRSWWRWMRRANVPAPFRLDQTDASTEYLVWAHEPVWPGGFRLRRSREFLTVLEFDVVLRLEEGQTLTTLWSDHLED